MFERLLALRSDVGLLAEEYDPRLQCQMGNFPQAFSHVALVNTAYNLARYEAPGEQRADPRASETGKTLASSSSPKVPPSLVA
jgi:hypothetical protein